MDWTPEIYQARIEDRSARIRHAGGSPSPMEIHAYQAACEGLPENGTALVLGMTPELRTMAAARFQSVVSVDASATAMEMFADWMPEDLRSRERLILGNWNEVVGLLDHKVDVILGDGIIGNLGGFDPTVELLSTLRGLLHPGGRCVMRNVFVPRGLDPDTRSFEGLLEMFRAGRLDASEFGFVSRMLGFHRFAYDGSAEILDNAVVFRHLGELRRAGLLGDGEWQALERYRFMGRNFFPAERTWRAILAEAGFSDPVTHPGERRLWAEFYPVQSFSPLT